jgi:hypothetical protein
LARPTRSHLDRIEKASPEREKPEDWADLEKELDYSRLSRQENEDLTTYAGVVWLLRKASRAHGDNLRMKGRVKQSAQRFQPRLSSLLIVKWAQ